MQLFQARKCLNNPEILCEILRLPLPLVLKLRNVWIALRQQQEPIDAESFEKYCSEIVEEYELLFPFAEMCQSVHRILRHGWMLVSTKLFFVILEV